MMYLDLDELPLVFEKRWFWSVTRPALARFRRRDHVGDPAQPLAESIRDLVQSESGHRPDGPVCLLTHLSYFGYCFNPVSFYYCFATAGQELEYIVAEVSNTPWGERTCYVVPASQNVDSGVVRHNPVKKMHVSPFMGMDIDYDWHFTAPTDRLSVFMGISRDSRRFFDVGMMLERAEISSLSLAGVLLRFPLMTFKVMAAIHWEALRLWLKRCPVYVHPAKKQQLQHRPHEKHDC